MSNLYYGNLIYSNDGEVFYSLGYSDNNNGYPGYISTQTFAYNNGVYVTADSPENSIYSDMGWQANADQINWSTDLANWNYFTPNDSDGIWGLTPDTEFIVSALPSNSNVPTFLLVVNSYNNNFTGAVFVSIDPETGNHYYDDTYYLPSGRWAGLAVGNGKYVLIENENAGRSLASTDGYTWTEGSIPNYDWTNVMFLNGRFVATSNTDTGYPYIASSIDGLAWFVETQLSGQNEIWNGATYGPVPTTLPTKNKIISMILKPGESYTFEPGIVLSQENTIVVAGAQNITFTVSGVETE